MSDLKNIMQNSSIAAPKGAWDFIATALDKQAEEEQTFVRKMFSAEIAPPSNLWSNIEKKIPAKNISTEKKSAKIFTLPAFKYAAAACIVGLLGVGVYSVIKNTSTVLPTPNAPQVVSNNKTTPNTPTVTTNTPQTIASNNVTTNTVETPTNTKATSPDNKATQTNTIVAPTNANTGLATVTNPLDGPVDPIKNSTGGVDTDINSNNVNQYITIVGPNGDAVKLSTKFSKQVGLFEGQAEEGIDVIIRESSLWRGKIAKWRKAMLNANITPSFDNIFDFDALNKTFQKNK
jgi:hypothetical protein